MRLNLNTGRMAAAVGGAAAVLFAAGEAKAQQWWGGYDPIHETAWAEIDGLPDPTQTIDYFVVAHPNGVWTNAFEYATPLNNSPVYPGYGAYAFYIDVSFLAAGTYATVFYGDEEVTSPPFVIDRTPAVSAEIWGSTSVNYSFSHMPTTAAYFYVGLNERTPTGDFFLGMDTPGMNGFGGGNSVVNYNSQGNYPMYLEATACDASFNCTTVALSPLF
jgi:hypothetical protein